MSDKNYWITIPAKVRQDNDLPYGARLLYGEINTLSQQTGKCWATNGYFADIYNVDRRTVTNWLKELRDKRYIAVEMEREDDSPVIKRRYIIPCAEPITLKAKKHKPVDQGPIILSDEVF